MALFRVEALEAVPLHAEKLNMLPQQAFTDQWGGRVISETHPPGILKTFLVGKNEILNRGPTKPTQKWQKGTPVG